MNEPSPLPPDRLDQWEKLEPRLYVYLGSFPSLSREAKEDILQRCLIAFWKKSATLESDARSWLYRVTRNAAIDALRSRKREEKRRTGAETEIDRIASPPSRYPMPEEECLRAEQEAFVGAFLSALHDRDRELLHLAFAEDVGYPEISRLLVMPLGTVKWKISSLKRRLAARYEKEFGHGTR